jgi:hypothetical protein
LVEIAREFSRKKVVASKKPGIPGLLTKNSINGSIKTSAASRKSKGKRQKAKVIFGKGFADC